MINKCDRTNQNPRFVELGQQSSCNAGSDGMPDEMIITNNKRIQNFTPFFFESLEGKIGLRRSKLVWRTAKNRGFFPNNYVILLFYEET